MELWSRRVPILALLLIVSHTLCVAGSPSKVEVRDGAYYVDGRRFLVNAIGYEPGARPGEDPYKQRVSNLAQIRQDLENIKAAGFNGIRTWSELSEDELKLVQASGLKIVFGIWIEPNENFADPKIIAKDLERVSRALAYTRNYDCVITYLIMNEPMPAHLHKVGAQASRELWTKLIDLIHREHPGIPVTISGNSAITGWLDLNLFDVYAHNTYDYRMEGSNFTHGYTNSNRYVAEINGGNKPVLVTEFGRSVSRQGAEDGGQYGGNALEVQAQALTRDYRELLDSGAAGVCPFYYADGWWKGGESSVHNDVAEEWFGFWGFRNLQDKTGYPRPVWYALKQYNEALVTSPRNQQFYPNEVPVEAFFQPNVKKFRVVYQDGVLLEAAPDAYGYFSGKLSFAGEDLKDRELIFESYDARARLLKVESIILLTGKDPIEWPTLELRTNVDGLSQAKEVPVEIAVKNGSVFSLGNELRYMFNPHRGWEHGEARTQKINPKLREQRITDSYQVPDDSVVLGIYAGADVRFGKFTRTIYTQKYLFRGNWADAIRVK